MCFEPENKRSRPVAVRFRSRQARGSWPRHGREGRRRWLAPNRGVERVLRARRLLSRIPRRFEFRNPFVRRSKRFEEWLKTHLLPAVVKKSPYVGFGTKSGVAFSHRDKASKNLNHDAAGGSPRPPLQRPSIPAMAKPPAHNPSLSSHPPRRSRLWPLARPVHLQYRLPSAVANRW